jgi:hypothetical protein
MRYSILTLLPLAVALGACGQQEGGQAPAGPAAPAESAAPAAAETPAAPPAAVEASAPQAAPATAPAATEDVVYDPIDVSKLQNTWGPQFNAGA